MNKCPHCDPKSFALKHPLKETGLFLVICDVHPLVEGHILIIPKKHLSCLGEFDKNYLKEFNNLYSKVRLFIKKQYGCISSFEHGIIGQTVFHSHIHLLPFKGRANEIVPEGTKYLKKINNFLDLKDEYKIEGKYLFFSIARQKWLVNTKLGVPRFFRDRFAKVLKVSKRGNWKTMRQNKDIMKTAEKEIKNLKKSWKDYIRIRR